MPLYPKPYTPQTLNPLPQNPTLVTLKPCVNPRFLNPIYNYYGIPTEDDEAPMLPKGDASAAPVKGMLGVPVFWEFGV